jgi:hypothetical protein
MILHGNDFVIIDESELLVMHRLVFNSIHRCGIDTDKIPEQGQLLKNLLELEDKIKYMMRITEMKEP